MSASFQNLSADKGATFRLSVQYKDPTETPIDLSGFEATFRLLERGSGTELDAATGTTDDEGWINVTVSDEDTALWPTGSKAYTLEIESPAGEVTRLLYGKCDVRSGFDV